MQPAFKVLAAAIIGGVWYHFGGEDASMALVFFL